MNYKKFLPKNMLLVIEQSDTLIKKSVDLLASFMELRFEKPVTQFDRENIEISIIRDLAICFGNYILDTDVITNVCPRMSGALCVDMEVIRNGQIYQFNTRFIHAGGHNIQCEHVRYVVKTELYKLNVNRILQEYNKRDKVEKLQDELNRVLSRQQQEVGRINERAAWTNEEIIKNSWFCEFANITWAMLPADVQERYGSEEKFLKDHTNTINGIISDHRSRYTPEYAKRIAKMWDNEVKKVQKRIDKLK